MNIGPGKQIEFKLSENMTPYEKDLYREMNPTQKRLYKKEVNKRFGLTNKRVKVAISTPKTDSDFDKEPHQDKAVTDQKVLERNTNQTSGQGQKPSFISPKQPPAAHPPQRTTTGPKPQTPVGPPAPPPPAPPKQPPAAPPPPPVAPPPPPPPPAEGKAAHVQQTENGSDPRAALMDAIRKREGKSTQPKQMDISGGNFNEKFTNDPLSCVWEEMKTHEVRDLKTKEMKTKYPMTKEGKTKYITDKFSAFIIKQLGASLKKQLISNNPRLILALFNQAEAIWQSSNAAGRKKLVPQAPWSSDLKKSNEQGKPCGSLSYAQLQSIIKGNNIILKACAEAAIEKTIEKEEQEIIAQGEGDPEKILNVAKSKHSISNSVIDHKQRDYFLIEFEPLLRYASGKGIKTDQLTPTDCKLELLLPLVTEDIDEIKRIKAIIWSRFNREFAKDDQEREDMYQQALRMGFKGSIREFLRSNLNF